MGTNLPKIFKFAELLNNFRDIKRGVLANGTDRFENDIEHVCMLTLMADYIISVENLDLDRAKVMRYCLAHDLVEIYAGDTYAYSKDKEHVNSKKDRELVAYKRLVTEFPEHKEFLKNIEGYEVRLDEESQFVYALDKLYPSLNIYLDNGNSWKKNKVGLSDVIAYKGEKMKFSPVVQKYWNELRELLEVNQHKLFPN